MQRTWVFILAHSTTDIHVASWFTVWPTASTVSHSIRYGFPRLSKGWAFVGLTAIGRCELEPCIISVWVACKFTCTVLHLRAVAWKIWGETERERDRDRERNRSWKHCDVIWSESETWYQRGKRLRQCVKERQQGTNVHKLLSLHTAPLISTARTTVALSARIVNGIVVFIVFTLQVWFSGYIGTVLWKNGFRLRFWLECIFEMLHCMWRRLLARSACPGDARVLGMRGGGGGVGSLRFRLWNSYVQWFDFRLQMLIYK